MRHIQYLFLLVGLMVCMGVGCKRDKCKRVTCVNGTCVDGICNCTSGYYGEDCNDVVNAGLDGGWSLTENCTAGADLYTVDVAATSGSLIELWLIGIWEQPDTVVATFAADALSFTVARQRLGNKEVDGEGTINELRDAITLQYRVYNLGSAQAFDQCAATLEKN